MNRVESTNVQALSWTNGGLRILDQRQLPEIIRFDDYTTAPAVAEAIRTMRVRGAPAIGIAAAFAVVLSVKQHFQQDAESWQDKVTKDMQLLAQSRPTAVNLFWALDRMRQGLRQLKVDPFKEMETLALQIHQEDIAANHKMGEMGADIIGEVKGVMTHCNAGALATGGYGTALGVIRSCVRRGLKNIYAGETRPWLQGSRLTVWELAQDKIPATLIADSAAASLMREGKIEWIIVGADRIAANGDVANKIGTYSLAVLAKQHQVKMMVVAPIATIDMNIANGSEIDIEHRNKDELLADCYIKEEDNNSYVTAWNPVFDVTPAALITAIVTERGVVFNPDEKGVGSLIDA